MTGAFILYHSSPDWRLASRPELTRLSSEISELVRDIKRWFFLDILQQKEQQPALLKGYEEITKEIARHKLDLFSFFDRLLMPLLGPYG